MITRRTRLALISVHISLSWILLSDSASGEQLSFEEQYEAVVDGRISYVVDCDEQVSVPLTEAVLAYRLAVSIGDYEAAHACARHVMNKHVITTPTEDLLAEHIRIISRREPILNGMPSTKVMILPEHNVLDCTDGAKTHGWSFVSEKEGKCYNFVIDTGSTIGMISSGMFEVISPVAVEKSYDFYIVKQLSFGEIVIENMLVSPMPAQHEQGIIDTGASGTIGLHALAQLTFVGNKNRITIISSKDKKEVRTGLLEQTQFVRAPVQYDGVFLTTSIESGGSEYRCVMDTGADRSILPQEVVDNGKKNSSTFTTSTFYGKRIGSEYTDIPISIAGVDIMVPKAGSSREIVIEQPDGLDPMECVIGLPVLAKRLAYLSISDREFWIYR